MDVSELLEELAYDMLQDPKYMKKTKELVELEECPTENDKLARLFRNIATVQKKVK